MQKFFFLYQKDSGILKEKLNAINFGDTKKLVDKEKNSNHKNSNSGKVNIVKYKLKTEEIKTINNKTFKNEFNNNIITVLRVRPESAKEKQYSNIKIIILILKNLFREI